MPGPILQPPPTMQLQVVTPPASAPGPVEVRVVNPDGGSGSLAGAYEYQGAPAASPAVTAVSPAFGPLTGGGPFSNPAQGVTLGRPSSRAITMRCTSEVPSPISRILASR